MWGGVKARDGEEPTRGWGQNDGEEKPGLFQLFEAWHKGLTTPAWSSPLPAQRCPPTKPRKLPSTFGCACANARMCDCAAGNPSFVTDIVPVPVRQTRQTNQGAAGGVLSRVRHGANKTEEKGGDPLAETKSRRDAGNDAHLKITSVTQKTLLHATVSKDFGFLCRTYLVNLSQRRCVEVK